MLGATKNTQKNSEHEAIATSLSRKGRNSVNSNAVEIIYQRENILATSMNQALQSHDIQKAAEIHARLAEASHLRREIIAADAQ